MEEYTRLVEDWLAVNKLRNHVLSSLNFDAANDRLTMLIKRIPIEGCTVWVEINGPRNEQMESISLVPDDIRELADWVIDKCPRRNGEGGYATDGFINLARFFTNPSNTLQTFHEPFRKLSIIFVPLPRLYKIL